MCHLRCVGKPTNKEVAGVKYAFLLAYMHPHLPHNYQGHVAGFHIGNQLAYNRSHPHKVARFACAAISWVPLLRCGTTLLRRWYLVPFHSLYQSHEHLKGKIAFGSKYILYGKSRQAIEQSARTVPYSAGVMRPPHENK